MKNSFCSYIPSDNKIVNMSRLKVYAEEKINVAKMIGLVPEIIVVKGENACYQCSFHSCNALKAFFPPHGGENTVIFAI